MKTLAFLSLTLLVCAGSVLGQANASTETDGGMPVGADKAAYEMLKNSRNSSRNFPADFGGYTADVIFNENGVVYKGTLDYAPKTVFKLEIGELSADLARKSESEIKSLIVHRQGGDFSKSDGKYAITFGADDKSPLGRLVCLNDEMGSCYRVKNNQVVQVNRVMGGELFSINILETTPAEDGRFLPRQFTVTYFDAGTKAVKRTQAFTDTYEKVGGIYLPGSRRIITSENGESKVRLIEFSNFKLKSAASQPGK